MQKIVKNAIKTEIKSQKLYEALYKKATTPNSKKLFETLITEEQRHEVLFKTFLDTGDIKEAQAKTNIYSGEYNIGHKMIDASFDAMELRDGIKDAVKFEREMAQKYYDLYMKYHRKEKELKYQDVFLELNKQEKKHEKLLIREYEKLFGLWDE